MASIFKQRYVRSIVYRRRRKYTRAHTRTYLSKRELSRMMETRDREKTIRSIFRPHTLEPIPLFIPLSVPASKRSTCCSRSIMIDSYADLIANVLHETCYATRNAEIIGSKRKKERKKERRVVHLSIWTKQGLISGKNRIVLI